jgi:hypothetical protein
MLAVAQQTWLGILGAVVPSVLGLMAALTGYLNRKALATPGTKSVGEIAAEVSNTLATTNEKTIGEMVSEVHGEVATNGQPYTQHGPTS